MDKFHNGSTSCGTPAAWLGAMREDETEGSLSPIQAAQAAVDSLTLNQCADLLSGWKPKEHHWVPEGSEREALRLTQARTAVKNKIVTGEILPSDVLP